MELAREAISKRLDKIDFNNIWAGFKRCEFVIYDYKKLYFKDKIVSWNNKFVGNTSISYKDRLIAIRKIKKKNDFSNINRVTSEIVHDMFYVYQRENQNIVMSDELKGLSRSKDINFYKIRVKESDLLLKALEMKDYKKREKLLSEILGLRALKKREYPDITDYEEEIESIEGSAEYVALKALRQLDKKEYRDVIEEIMENIQEDDVIFNIRNYSYYYMPLMLVLLDCMDIELKDNTLAKDILEVDNLITDIDIYNYRIQDVEFIKLNESYIRYQRKILKKFSDFNLNSGRNVKGRFNIKKCDPMSMVKLNDKILHKKFVGLYDLEEEEVVFLKGPIVTTFSNDESHIIEYTR